MCGIFLANKMARKNVQFSFTLEWVLYTRQALKWILARS
mgnify:CR=1 FL=1